MIDQMTITIIFLGCVGGLASDLVAGIIRMPVKVRRGAKIIGYDVGTIGTIIIGGVTAYAFWALGLANPASPGAYGTAIISGFGGARVLNDILQQRFLTSQRNTLADELVKQIELVDQVENPEANNEEGQSATG
jgi:hypothetical protein